MSASCLSVIFMFYDYDIHSLDVYLQGTSVHAPISPHTLPTPPLKVYGNIVHVVSMKYNMCKTACLSAMSFKH